jgi:sortase A
VPIARLIVPRHRIDEIVLAGANGRTLAFGPAYHEDSAKPGTMGVSIITGHRDTHFRFLSRLEPGDRIDVETPQGTLVSYRVLGNSVVDSRLPFLVSEEDGNTLLLVTCYPFDTLVPGGPLRYVVMAEMGDR